MKQKDGSGTQFIVNQLDDSREHTEEKKGQVGSPLPAFDKTRREGFIGESGEKDQYPTS